MLFPARIAIHCGLLFATALPLCAADPPWINAQLVDIKKIDPTILVELRYASARNIAGRPLYPPTMPALVRPSVALRLMKAQAYLHANGYGLKIWDAYRPPHAQLELWHLLPNNAFVADPSDGRGSLHSWGVAVDATMVDEHGKEVAMPTDFDVFTAAANLRYKGNDPQVHFHLRVLQTAMRRGGFYGLRTEWWHFISYDWKKYGPVNEVKFSSQ